MKLSDNRELWQPAPINGKDVDWGFLTEVCEEYADNMIAINNSNDACAFFFRNNSITVTMDGNELHVQAFDKAIAQEVTNLMCWTINSCTDNGDLYAECDIRYWTIDFYRIRFYHTDPNNH